MKSRWPGEGWVKRCGQGGLGGVGVRVWIMHQENNISNKNDIFQICSTAQITHFMVEYSPRRGKRPHLLLPPSRFSHTHLRTKRHVPHSGNQRRHSSSPAADVTVRSGSPLRLPSTPKSTPSPPTTQGYPFPVLGHVTWSTWVRVRVRVNKCR